MKITITTTLELSASDCLTHALTLTKEEVQNIGESIIELGSDASAYDRELFDAQAEYEILSVTTEITDETPK